MSPPRPRIALPLVVAVAAAGVGAWLLRDRGAPPAPPEPTPPAPAVVGAFEAKERGAFVASPLVAGPHVYLAAVRDTGLHPTGAVLCLDRATRQLLWTFDDGGAMLHMFSTPCLAD